MTAHRALRDMYEAPFLATDPGDGKTISVERWGGVTPMVSAAAETRTLAQPTKAGLEHTLIVDTYVADITLTVTGGYNQAADTSIVFNTAGDWVRLGSVKVGSSYYWRVLASEGVTLSGGTNALTGVTAGTVTASKAVVVDANKDAGDFRNVDVVNLDAGASGTAGSVDVFPTTASKGKLAITCTDQTGDTTVGLVIGAMAAARTITLPDPLASADILTGKMAAVARTATSDGTTTGTIADAGLLQFVTVTSDHADKIIILPTPTPGRIVMLANGATGYEIRTSAPGTIGINGGTGAGAESAIGANTLVVAVCESATSWKGFGLAADGTLAKIEVAA